MSIKRVILFLLLALCLQSVRAAYYPSTRSRVQHYLDLSFSAGASVPVTKGAGLTNQIGGDGQVALSYEIGRKGFFFGIGVGAQYDLSRRKINQFVDATPGVDPNMNAMTYRYVFNDFSEMQHTLMLTAPVQIGYYLTNQVYMAVGAKVQMPFYGSFSTKTNLYTEGAYTNLIEYVSRNVPSFGYYPEDEYKSKGSVAHKLASEIRVAPGLEIGGVFLLKKRLSCKVAFYAEYSIPVVYSEDKPYELVDYSRIASNPGTRTMDNLKDNIAFNPTTLSRYNASVVDWTGQNVLSKAAQNIAAGIRFTLHLNVSPSPKICMCVKD